MQSTMSFVDLGIMERPGAVPGLNLEYTVQTCRGQMEEQSEGRIACMGPKGDELLPINRHYFTALLVKDGFVYAASSSAVQDRWEVMGPNMYALANSFEFVA